MPNFEKTESLENWIAWKYFNEDLRWASARIAYELDVNEQRLIEWINARASAMMRLADKQPGKVKEIRKQLEEKYPTSRPEERKAPNIDIGKVIKLYAKGLTLPEISKKLKVKHEDFIFWWNENLKLINVKIRQQNITENVITQ